MTDTTTPPPIAAAVLIMDGGDFGIYEIDAREVKPGDYIPGDGLVESVVTWPRHNADAAIYTIDYDLEADRCISKFDVYAGRLKVIRSGAPS